MIEDIDFETRELRIDADYWDAVKPVVTRLRKLYGTIGVEAIPNVEIIEVCGLNFLFQPIGCIALMAELFFEIIPVHSVSAHGKGAGRGTAKASVE
jgi:hypothetical protein